MNSTAMPEAALSFLNRLRSETSTSHTNLESLPISAAIVSPDVTKSQYVNYLNLMHDVVRDIEKSVYPTISEVVTDLDERKKEGFLKADLKALDFEGQPKPTAFDNHFSLPFAMGIFYVIEGSTLGGRVILKNIEKAFQITEANGGKYFSGYGATTGSHWKKFLDMLLAYEAQTDTADEIIEGATFAFDAIHNHLSTFKNAD